MNAAPQEPSAPNAEGFVLERSQIVPRSRTEVFAFFADASNLEAPTPPSLHFTILTPAPIEMRGRRVHRLSPPARGCAVPVAHPHRVVRAEQSFVDVQAAGPYRRWRHVHEFVDAPEGTIIHDRVEYELPLGALGRAARALFVRRQLDHIFDFRRATIERLFGRAAN